MTFSKKLPVTFRSNPSPSRSAFQHWDKPLPAKMERKRGSFQAMVSGVSAMVRQLPCAQAELRWEGHGRRTWQGTSAHLTAAGKQRGVREQIGEDTAFKDSPQGCILLCIGVPPPTARDSSSLYWPNSEVSTPSPLKAPPLNTNFWGTILTQIITLACVIVCVTSLWQPQGPWGQGPLQNLPTVGFHAPNSLEGTTPETVIRSQWRLWAQSLGKEGGAEQVKHREFFRAVKLCCVIWHW